MQKSGNTRAKFKTDGSNRISSMEVAMMHGETGGHKMSQENAHSA
jgi:hypothetical protein